MAFFFNLDFEKYLFSGKDHYIPNTKFNSSYEYLLLYLESEIENQIEYGPEYISDVENLTRKKITFCSTDNEREYWFGCLEYKERARMLNSKIELYRFLERQQNRDSDFIKKVKKGEIFPNHYVKYDGGFSGNKIYSGKAPFNGVAIVEPILDRVIDFSLLIFNNKLYFYTNEVNNKLAFKSSNFSDLSTKDFFQEYNIKQSDIDSFFDSILTIREDFMENETSPYSIDSFIYKEPSGDFKIFTAHEINFRKTMGYIGVKLGEIFNQNYYRFQLRLLRSNERGINLSPPNHLYPSSILFLNS